jgi:hypothetical protein
MIGLYQGTALAVPYWRVRTGDIVDSLVRSLALKLGLRLQPMPWKVRIALDERKAFIREWSQQEVPFAALCRDFRVSRQTGYKWLER